MSYRLTEDDIAIFEASRTNGSAFTGYYFNNCISNLDDGSCVEGWQFLPWQLRVHHGSEPEQSVVGGYGCLAADAGVYDVELGHEVPISELYRQKRAPLVLAWTGLGFAIVRAHIPFRKGMATLYRVATEGGREIKATSEHRFLTPEGWRRLGDLSCESLLGAPANLPETIHAEDALRYWQKAQGYLGDCWRCRHQCDAQPLLAQDTAQVSVPLQGDVHGRNHDDSPQDVLWGLGPGHNHQDHSVYLRARPDYVRQVEHHALPTVEYDVVSSVCAPFPGEEEDQEQRRCGSNPNQVLPVLGFEEGMDRAVRVSFCTSCGQISLYPIFCNILEGGFYLSQDGPQRRSRFRVYPEVYLEIPWSESPNSFRVYNHGYIGSLLESSDHSLFHYIIWDKVCQIEEVGEDYFYDVHVPIFNNYVANSLIHHNTGKTGGLAMSGFVWCATTPHFKFLEAAPVAWQSLQMFEYIVTRLEGSKANRLVRKYVYRPYPKVLLHNGSTMEFMSADEQGEKIKTWEGDWIVIDQAEDVDDLAETIRNLGSRLRGRRPDGSQRLGRLTCLANAGDSPELWDRYDQAESLPAEYLSLTISYKQNPYLSKVDIRNLERRVGDSPEKIQQWLEGKRPIGKGKEFAYSLIEPCVEMALNDIMTRALSEKREGFICETLPKCGIVWWEMPKDEGREYLVIGDPGQNDPPNRNSPVVMVWDITDVPNGPAVLRAFHWVSGGGSYWPFINEYRRYVEQYNAHGQNAHDATGIQKAFDELIFVMDSLLSEGMNMQGEKMLMLLFSKMLMGKGLMRFPKIDSIIHQLTHYQLPDTKIRQDITSVIIMTAGWLKRLFWEKAGPKEEESLELPRSRTDRSIDRMSRSR